jgi:hypothetical protein
MAKNEPSGKPVPPKVTPKAGNKVVPMAKETREVVSKAKDPKVKVISRRFHKEKETTNTVRFLEDPAGGKVLVKYLYIQQEEVGDAEFVDVDFKIPQK